MISKWKNNLLNLLKIGGLVAAITLGGASLGVAVQTSVNTTDPIINEITNNDKNTSTINLGVLGLYGGFKTLSSTETKAAKQAILGIEVDASKTENNEESIGLESQDKEIEILDLSKTIGNLEWIKKQLKFPNYYTSAISKKILKKVDYKQKITFNIEEDITYPGTLFNETKIGVFAVEVEIIHVPATERQGAKPAKAESWSFVYNLKVEVDSNDGKQKAGIIGTATVKHAKSEVFIKVLDERALENLSLQVIYWKPSGAANPNGSNALIGIILNKKTGKVFVLYTNIDTAPITKRTITVIGKPSITL